MVDEATLLKPPDDEWVSYGRDYAETHHSPLTQIDATNVSRLGLAWSVEVGSEGKIETTPLVFNGVLYGTSTWSRSMPIDVRTGKLKWQWDPAIVRGGFEADGPRAVLRAGQPRRRDLLTAASTSACSTAAWSRSTRKPAAPIGRCKPRRPAPTIRSPARRASSRARS